MYAGTDDKSQSSGEARLAAHCLWSLGCWSYLNCNRGHGSILMWLQRSDLTFNMRVDVMMPAFNLEPKYRVTMLTTAKWTRWPGTAVVKGLVWYAVGSRMLGGNEGWSLWAIFGKKVQYLSRKARYSFPGQDMLPWPVLMKLNKCYIIKIHLYLLRQSSGSESRSGC